MGCGVGLVRLPDLDCLRLRGRERNSLFRDDISQIVDFANMESTFAQGDSESGLAQLFEDILDQRNMILERLRIDEDVVNIDDHAVIEYRP